MYDNEMKQQMAQYRNQYQALLALKQPNPYELMGGVIGGGIAAQQKTPSPQRATGSGNDDSEKLLLLEEEGE